MPEEEIEDEIKVTDKGIVILLRGYVVDRYINESKRKKRFFWHFPKAPVQREFQLTFDEIINWETVKETLKEEFVEWLVKQVEDDYARSVGKPPGTTPLRGRELVMRKLLEEIEIEKPNIVKALSTEFSRISTELPARYRDRVLRDLAEETKLENVVTRLRNPKRITLSVPTTRYGAETLATSRKGVKEQLERAGITKPQFAIVNGLVVPVRKDDFRAIISKRKVERLGIKPGDTVTVTYIQY